MDSVNVRFRNVRMKQSITYSLSVMEVAKILFREGQIRLVTFELKEGRGVIIKSYLIYKIVNWFFELEKLEFVTLSENLFITFISLILSSFQN